MICFVGTLQVMSSDPLFSPARTLAKYSLSSLISKLLVFLIVIMCSWSACAEDWELKNSIDVGNSPERAAITPNGREVYVANRGTCDISVIDTQRNVLIRTIKLGKSPKAIAASNDHVYILEQDLPWEDPARPCPGSNAKENQPWLAIINTSGNAVAPFFELHLPGTRWDEMALTQDGKSLYLTGVYERGVYLFDTSINRLQPLPVIHDFGCPIGIALSEQTRRIYVNYQCYGPEGDLRGAHDTIGVYELSQSYRRLNVITNLPNVGGQLALSPDETQLWDQGFDACSRPDYPHTDACPGFPVRVVNVIGIGTSGFDYVRSYGFSLADSNGRISFSPEGEAFIGEGIYLKEFPSEKGAKRANLEVVNRLPIASVGDIVFRRTAGTPARDQEYMYVPVTDKGLVYVMARSETTIPDTDTQKKIPVARDNIELQPGGKARVVFSDKDVAWLPVHIKSATSKAYGNVSPLNLVTLIQAVSSRGAFGQCSGGNMCIRVPPEDLVSVLKDRGATEPGSGTAIQPLQKCGEEIAKDRKLHPDSEVYRCMANVVLSRAVSGKIDQTEAIALAMDLRALETNEEYLQFIDKNRDHPAFFDDVTLRRCHIPQNPTSPRTIRLYDPQGLRDSLGSSAVILSVFSWGQHTYTVFLSRDKELLRDDNVDWDTVFQKIQDFRARLSAEGQIDRRPPQVAKDLYDMLIGNDVIDNELKKLEVTGSKPKPTLVWLAEGQLRYIPIAALSPDLQHYLVENYSSVMLTTPSPPCKKDDIQTGDWEALAVGTDRSSDYGPLSNVKEEFNKLFFKDGQEPEPGKIHATVLFNDQFTSSALADGLQRLQRAPTATNRLVFIATHSILGIDDITSYLVTGDPDPDPEKKKLNLRELSDETKYPLQAIDLVTFSACETTGGRTVQNGDEVEGLALRLDERGNGAHDVLSTLWIIQPSDSLSLMSEFNRGLKQGLSKAETLRHAQYELLNRGPRVWASFILIGDWH